MRYLLPVAATLLQQLPVALLQLSDLHAALGCYNRHKQEHEHANQLQLQLLPQHVRGYSHFMKPEDQLQHQQQQQQQQLMLALGTSASGQGVDFPAAEFEMVLDDATYAPTFVVHLKEGLSSKLKGAAAAAGGAGTLAYVSEVDDAVSSLVQVLPVR